MIVILEGTSGSGKTTYAQQLIEQGYEYKKVWVKSIGEIYELIIENKDKDIVFDRMFGLYMIYSKTPEEKIVTLNNFLANLDYVQCYKFMCPIEVSKARRLKGNPYDEKIANAIYKEYEGYNRIFKLMPVFKEIGGS